MECRCGSKRQATVNAKCSDMCHVSVVDEKGSTHQDDGYVPRDMGIGGGDYIKFTYCLDCGSLFGDFPIEETELEMSDSEDDEDEE